MWCQVTISEVGSPDEPDSLVTATARVGRAARGVRGQRGNDEQVGLKRGCLSGKHISIKYIVISLRTLLWKLLILSLKSERN